MNLFEKAKTISRALILLFVPLLVMVSLMPSVIVSAQGDAYDPCEVFGNCLSGTEQYANESADNIVVNIVLGFSFFLIYVGGAVAVLFIIFGGYKMVSANGDDSSYKAGRAMVVNSVIGLILIIISVTIVRLVTVVITGAEIPGLFG